MVDTASRSIRELFLDKEPLRKIVAEQNRLVGIMPDPTAAPEKAQAMIRALGIRLEDNGFSRGIIAAREE